MAELKKGWKEIPIGGLIKEAGSALKYKTGDWRSRRPIVDFDKCTSCLTCWIYCPDSAVIVKDQKMTGINYDYCKGCGICASVCPVKCISMIPEAEAKKGESK